MSSLFVKSSNTYFWYFAVHGLVIPFLALFLNYRGFSSLVIGELLAIYTASRIIGPTVWAIFADKTGKQLFVIRLGAFLAFACFSLLFWVQGYWPIAFALAMFSLFWTAILPQLEVMTNRAVKRSPKIYARIRLWGSLGFFVASVVAGEIIDVFSPEAFTWLGFIILLSLWGATLLLKQPRASIQSLVNNSSIFNKIFSKTFFWFFISGLLLQISFGPFYTFFALYLRDLDYPSYAVGLFLGVSVFAEIGIFLILGTLFKYFSLKSLLIVNLGFSAIRWFITGNFAESAWILGLAQCLHAFSFGMYHSVSIQYLQQHFNHNQQNRGQAIYIAGVYGIGGAIGAFVAGIYWQEGVGAQTAYELATYSAIIAIVFACFIPSKSTVKKR
ncbi:MFS transporter [Thalassotalea profundi]|uniref:MFS transporter n=1 Tax=Thalassotalea profundi TaxID=2036687 RepID=A0ABQ3IFF3_9GAMM|nr:MFS transporter [Thalassotalea profundi]GHE80266.1 MFS transporter [Thalassotalea profundi]